MKFTPVDEIPERKRGWHHLQDFIKEFVDSDVDNAVVVINDHEYKSPEVCRNCLWVAIRRSGYRVRVYNREGKVYLTKDLKD